MPHWLTVVLPIITLIIGAALTMASQAMQDRRKAAHEEKVQRLGFFTTNFEVHRTAILEMQEVVRDCHEAFLEESRRRSHDGFYKYFDEKRLKGITVELTSNMARIERIDQAMKDTSSENWKTNLEAIVDKEAKGAIESFNSAKEGIREMGEVLETIYPFWDQLVVFIGRLRLCQRRSGSNSVINCSETYIEAVFKWSEIYSSAKSRESAEHVKKSCYELNKALSNALKYGPYDSYKSTGN